MRARQRLQRQGEAGFDRVHKKRRRHGIEDPEILQQAARMLADGTSLRRTARELDLCYATLRTYKLKGLLPAVEEAPQPAASVEPESAPPETDAETVPTEAPAREQRDEPDPQAAASVEPETAPAETDAGTVRTQALGREQRNRRDAQAPQGRATHDTQGRAETSLGGKSEQEPRFPSPASAVAGGGVLTALPVLLAEGLLAHAGKLHLPQGYYGVRSVLLTLAFLLLLRLRRVERLDTVQPGEWGYLLGLDRCPCPRTLRRRLRQLVEHPERLAAWRGALAQGWAAEDPDAVATLFVDGHVKVYTGKGRLQKQFVPRQKLCLPAATSYWTHQLGGAPLLCVHKGVSGSVAAEIREGIVPQLEELGLAGEGADPERPRLTLVFDRNGWSPPLFTALRKRGIAVISWRKGKQAERWPEKEFQQRSIPLPGPLGTVTLEGRVAERKATLSTGCPVREIRFWIDRRRPLENRSGQPRKPIRRSGRPGPGQRQPALVTTHPGHSMEQVAGLLRARWTQENFFKYMREEFGLDKLAAHTLADVDPDEQVVNPGWRFLNNAVERLRRRAADLRLELAGTPRGSKQAHQLQADIRTADRHLEGLRTARRESGRKMRAGDLSAEDRLQALTTPMRDLFDALRMIVYRAETRLAAALAPGLSRPETARTLVKAMLSGDASIVPDPSAGTLTVRLLHQARRGHDLALAPLLEELNQTRTLYPGTSLRLVYEILPDDPGAGGASVGDSAGPSRQGETVTPPN